LHRLAKDPCAPGPPPGAYDVRPQWESRSVVPLSSGPAARIPKLAAPSGDVGPGNYNLPGSMGAKKSLNRKDIMVSTESRFQKGMGGGGGKEVPGPASYYPEYHYGSLIRPTFNIAIAEASRTMY
jgi:hypothetical protein